MYKINHYFVSTSLATLAEPISKDNVNLMITQLTVEHDNLPENDVLLIIDAEAIAGLFHLYACIHFTLKSFEQKNNIANNFNAEIMLYLAGRRQISKAISKVGVSTTTKKIAMIHLIHSTKKNPNKNPFDFQNFFDKIKIKLNDFKSDISELKITNIGKIMRNLEISNDMLETFSSGEEQSKNKIIEKLAIEKSALLNLNK